MNKKTDFTTSIATAILAVMLFITAGAILFAFAGHNSTQSKIIQDAVPVAKSSNCNVTVCRDANHGGACTEEATNGKPFVIKSDMENALLYVPEGTSMDFTTDGIGCKSVVLNNYDNTAFIATDLENGFRLTVRNGIPEGTARTTDISVDGRGWYIQFRFTHACE